MALERTRAYIREKVLRRPPKASYTDPSGWVLEKSLGRSRQVAPQGLIAGSRTAQGIWVPVTRPEGLVLLTDLVWILGAGVDRVVEEVNKGGWDFEPLFQAKCVVCGAEYDVEPDMCDTDACFSTDFEQADPHELEGGPWKDGGILALLDRPNWDPRTGRVIRAFKDLLKDATYYNNVIGWWNWEVILNAVGRPKVLNSMNSESMRVVEDPNLSLPGDWFCPACHGEKDDIDHIFQHGIPKEEESPTCSEHGVFLKRPDWVQLGEGDHIVAVWGVDEVLTDMPRARGYRVYPRSKVHRTWALGQTMRWTERYDLAALSGQRAPDAMVTVEGRGQGEVNAMLTQWEDWRKEHPEYEGVIWLGLGTEAGKVQVHHFLGDLINRDFIAWGEAAMKAVAMNLGVSFVFMGGETAGRLGTPEEVLQVAYNTIEENQAQSEEFVNGKLLPLFPEIKSWRWVMKPPAPEDMEKKAAEAAAWFNAAKAGREAGANVKLDPQAPFDWPLIIEGWEDRKETPEVPPGGIPGGPPGAEVPARPPQALTLAQKRWEPFTGPRGGQGARSSETGREVFGEEARRVLAGQETGEAEPEPEGAPEGGDEIPPDQEALVADVQVAEVRRDEVLGTLEVLGTAPIDQFQAGEAEPVDLERRAEAYAELMRQGIEFPPLVVFGRRSPEDKFQVIDGHARLEAARLAGKDTVGAEITLVNPQGRAVKMMTLEKSLTTRNIPPKEAVAGIRRAEDELSVKLKKRLDKAARDFKRMAGRRPTATELRRLTADVAIGLQEEFGRLGEQYVGRAYRLGLEEERAVIPEAEFEAQDRSAVRQLQDDPDFLKGRLSKVVADATGTIAEEIRTALLEGENTGAAARRAADRLGEEAWKVERIVRSETTRVANRARFEQFKKHGRPEDTYSWISAGDDRVDAHCRDLEAGSPWKLQELITASNDGLPHPNCRCTIRRHVALS